VAANTMEHGSVESLDQSLMLNTGSSQHGNFSKSAHNNGFLGIRDNDETHDILARASIASFELVSASQTFKTMPLPNLPEIVLIGSSGVREGAPFLEALMSTALDDGLDFREPASNSFGQGSKQFNVNCEDGVPTLLPAFSLVDIPNAASMGRGRRISIWCKEVCAYLERSRESPLSIFHVVCAKTVSRELRNQVPAARVFKSNSFKATTKYNIRLTENDQAILQAAVQAGAAYTIVVADANEIAIEESRQSGIVRLLTAHPEIVKIREQVLSQALQQNVVSCASDAKKKVEADVILTDPTTGRGRTFLWRKLWSYALAGRFD